VAATIAPCGLPHGYCLHQNLAEVPPQPSPMASDADINDGKEPFLQTIEVHVCPTFPEVSNENSSSSSDSASSEEGSVDEVGAHEDAMSKPEGQNHIPRALVQNRHLINYGQRKVQKEYAKCGFIGKM
jgi:hypothetical protein